jgi:hypothetical protein
MNKKEIFLDKKKFNLFLERMDSKMTLNESEQKELLVEGWIDDVIRSAKNASVNVAGVIGKNLPASIISKTTKNIDDFVQSVEGIYKGISDNLENLKSIRNVIGIDAISTLKNKYDVLLRSVVDSFGFDKAVTNKLDDFIRGNVDDLDPDVRHLLSDAQMDIVSDLFYTRASAIGEMEGLDILIKFADVAGNNPNILDLFNSMYTEGSVKSLDEFAAEWKGIDDLVKNDPDGMLHKLWYNTKNKIKGNPKNSQDAYGLIKNMIKNNDVYITAKKGWRKKIIHFLQRKITGKVKEINLQLNTKNIDWDNSLVYISKDGNLNIITARNKKEIGRLKTHLENNGITNFRELDSNGIKSTDLGNVENESLAGRKNRTWKWIKIALLGGVVVGGGLLTYCTSKKNIFSKEMLRNMKVDDPEGFEEGEYENPGWWDRASACVGRAAIDVVKATRKVALSLFNANVRPHLHNLAGGIKIYLNEKCGRENNSSKDVDGKQVWDYPCTKCLDCENDISVDEIKIDGLSVRDKYTELLGDLDPSLLFPADESGQGGKLEQMMREIKSDAKNDKISQFLTDSGEAITLEDMVKLICGRHRLNCLIDQFNDTISEFYKIEGMSCDEIDSHMTEKLNFINKLNNDGLLNWGEDENKIDVSVLQESDGFSSAQNVGNIIEILKIDKDGSVRLCKDSTVKITKEGEGDVTINLSNMMDEMWEEGISKLDCATYQYSFRPTSKINMREALTTILLELVEDENIKSFITGIDIYSTEWATEFDEWWIKQRELCGVND